MSTPTKQKAASLLVECRARSGKFEYKDEMYSGIRVLSFRGQQIKDIEISRTVGVVGDMKTQTKIIDPSQELVVHALGGGSVE